jgi:eukaryotic-like serine/threonine-protein kinase
MGQLAAGSLLGPYRIEGVLGAGGMGRVYKAVDTRLDRPVAIKASDERFSERFALEARAISALNHPHICTLYDVGPDYLVMELIDGETLADRIAAGPIPLDDALAIAEQIADALEAAHSKGIVHRDLKPANIRLTSDGSVKVLDFGLAKILHGDSATAAAGLTRDGAALGTSGYMAPEQIFGQPVDKRADIWAFGVLLHEMLTGERPSGSSSGARKRSSGVRRAAVRVPREVQRLLQHCLAEDPRERLRDIGDFRFLLDDEVPDAAPQAPSRRAFAAAVAVAGGAAAVGAWGWLRAPQAPPPERARFIATLPPRTRVYREAVLASSLALSPDGKALVIAATGHEGQRLYVRRIDELEATPIEGTGGAAGPFFSPDGVWIGFYSGGRLRRVPAEGGAPIDIAAAPGAPIGASWSEDGRILYTFGWRSSLLAARAGGGQPEVLVRFEGGASGYVRQPFLLPGGRAVLFVLREPSANVIVALDLQSGRRAVLTEGTGPAYSSGCLLVARESSLLAAPFDASNLTLLGPLVPLVERVALEAGGALHYAVSQSGALAYLPGGDRNALVVAHIEGDDSSVIDEQPRFHRPRFSPDGRALAVGVSRASERSGDDVWIYEVVARGPGRRLTFDGGTGPNWAPDGSAVAFAADPFWTLRRENGLYTKDADGRAQEQRVLDLALFHRPVAWSRHGVFLELTTEEGEFWIELVAGGERRRLVRGINARLSPDEQWLAYVSDSAGQNEVYLTPAPDGGSRWLVGEGSDPTWAPSGTELYYIARDQLVAAKLDMADGLRVVSQRVVREPFSVATYADYDVSPDGGALAFVRSVDPLQDRRVVLAFDWLARLEAARP